MVANKDDARNLLSSLHPGELKRGKATSEEGFKLGLFWELEKMATF
jgi:hypothetical protein